MDPVTVLIVDNASGDGSDEQIAQAIERHGWGGWARLLRATVNGGFAAGNNVALRAILDLGLDPEFVWLLNPDTIVRPGAINILVDFMRAHPDVGIAGGRSEDPDETPQVCCFPFPTALREFSLYLGVGALARFGDAFRTNVGIPQEPREVGWVSGAHMMIRRAVLDVVGLMDEQYFLYYEETDFTLKAWRNGWRCWHVPDSRIVHLVGQSSGVTVRDSAPRRLPAYWFESRRRYFVGNHGRLYAILTDLGVIAACGLARLRRLVQPTAPATPPHFVADLIRHGALSRHPSDSSPRAIATS